MTRAKRQLRKNNHGEENAPLNRNGGDLTVSSEDAVGLLLHLSRHSASRDSDKSTHKAAKSRSARGQQRVDRTHGSGLSDAVVGPRSSRRRDQQHRLHPIAQNPHLFSHISDDEGECERNTSASSNHADALLNHSAKQNDYSDANARSSFTTKSSRVTTSGTCVATAAGGELLPPPVAMALSPPPRLPNVEFGSVVKDDHNYL